MKIMILVSQLKVSGSTITKAPLATRVVGIAWRRKFLASSHSRIG